MKLGQNIYELRKKEKLSQESLAEKIGVTRQTISNWELDTTAPNPEQLKELSKVFQVSIDYIVENEPFIHSSKMDNEIFEEKSKEETLVPSNGSREKWLFASIIGLLCVILWAICTIINIKEAHPFLALATAILSIAWFFITKMYYKKYIELKDTPVTEPTIKDIKEHIPKLDSMIKVIVNPIFTFFWGIFIAINLVADNLPLTIINITLCVLWLIISMTYYRKNNSK